MVPYSFPSRFGREFAENFRNYFSANSRRRLFDGEDLGKGRHWFATNGEEKGARVIVIQLEPQHARELLQSGARFTAYSRAKDCVMIDLAIVKNWE